MNPRHRIVKVLNSSVVLAIDESGKEVILIGRGIGYARKPGDQVSEDEVNRVFLPSGDSDKQALFDLLSDIAPEYAILTRDIVGLAQRRLEVELNPHLLLVLTDHIQFAVERESQGIRPGNSLAWEIRTYYPVEYQIGCEALEMIADRVSVRLSDDEAANIAYHLVNARTHQDGAFDAFAAAGLMAEIVEIIRDEHPEFEAHSDLDHRRLLVHVQFFVERLFTGRLLEGTHLYPQLAEQAPRAMALAERIRRHVSRQQPTAVTDEETAYLALHIERVIHGTLVSSSSETTPPAPSGSAKAWNR
ncbi:PRD domain-containing protein [Frondihabitans cladoniiphilus]|uniref:PRD domain-containing protein n=1 Tax=Frondihabitans cladoniiphilus TaxID=715785 RepID=A0ABP8VHX3_9MICO